MTEIEFTNTVLSFEKTEEKPHFDRTAFKVIGKRIFATLHSPTKTANLKLPLAEQSVFSNFGDAIYPVNNKWGLQGWTCFEIDNLPHDLLLHALEIAYNHVFDKK
ncbi:MAG: MmcQ/YjbR family DNA-binding protein [Flavobacteriales bacterium]|nr:MmcQ/YjbR family DNA-binding protein [Flavobacteriales bacterium]